MNALFSHLNEQQAQAVQATEGRVRIIAGAGSGKTRVIAHRYAYLVNELGIDPGNILCMTFTNKAAQEMKHRISGLVPAGYVNDFVCTIHGFCVKFLRQEIHRLGFPKTFTVLDEDDAKSLAKKVLADFNINRKESTVKKFLIEIKCTKSTFPQQKYIENYFLVDAKIKENPNTVQAYFYEQLKTFSLDFEDLIFFTLYILRKFPKARNFWQKEINYLMVDETQDCNTNEWGIIELLTKKSGNLCVVGDPDQAIYEWRGAKPCLFVSFESDTDVTMARNYRSTPNILNVANSIIVNNKNRLPKDLYTERDNAEPVTYFHAKHEGEEAEWIANRILHYVENRGSSYRDFAILYRANHLSRIIEKLFVKKGIPYVMWGGVRFFERREVKDALAYLRLVSNTADDLSFQRIVNVPSRHFGNRSMERLQEMANDYAIQGRRLSLYDTLKRHSDDHVFSHCDLREFIATIELGKRLMREGAPLSDLADTVFSNSGLLEDLRNDTEAERLENVKELMAEIKQYETEHGDDGNSRDVALRQYLQDIALFTNADYKKEEGKVKLMTIHQAKGLEFPYVFVMGLNEGVFPNHRAIRERLEAAEEEERRLMYVAVTRAMHELFLSDTEGYDFVNRDQKSPSRFILEVNDGLLHYERKLDKQLIRHTKQKIKLLEAELNMLKDFDTAPSTQFKKGHQVKHKVFGEGTVVEIKDNGSVVVRFGKQRKTLLPRVLEKLPTSPKSK
ncbi:MAG: ATP-dependent helicase [bacterium]|nr:ATP-dependent helicase [bacterium]